MRTLLRRATKGLLFAIVALLLAIVCMPPFLDRIYYRGPVSDHFDGQRFFNPEDAGAAGRSSQFSPARMARFLARRDRAVWPERVAVRPGRPVAAVTPCEPLTGGVVHESWSRCTPLGPAGTPPRIDPDRMVATWIGHATVLVQTRGIAILTDPIWSDRASPLSFAGPRRVRAPGLRLEDLPKIDVVLVSHDHYDHLDIPTLKRLWVRDRPLIVTSLGNDAVLRRQGLEAVARDWSGRVRVRPDVTVVVERVHHWGSRTGTDRNRALWSGFTVELPGGNLFFAGDTGTGDGTWVDTAAARGPVRLALLPIGAYLPREMMQPSHIGPVEAVDVFRRLRAAHALAIHWGTFQLSNEAIDDPPRLLAQTLRGRQVAAGRFRSIEVGVPWEVPR